jgi:hypothetical protein
MGYFKQTPTDDIYSGWPDAEFELVKAGGLLTGAYCSQLDDPTWVRTRATALGIISILDDESGIDADNAGTDGWLATSGAHLYGGSGVQATHRTHGHPGYVFAEYPTAGNPDGLNWPPGVAPPVPARPMGWQYADSGRVGGLSVDLSVFDPAIFGAPVPAPNPPQETKMLILFYATNVNGKPATFIADGISFRWIESAAQNADVLAVGAVVNGKPVQIWNAPPAAPVADPMAFGTPANAATAAQLGLPFP